MENGQKYFKRCTCGKKFMPKISGQFRCMQCIMVTEPPMPKKNIENLKTQAFAEWFIYHWENIRQAAEKKCGRSFREEAKNNEHQS